MIAHALRESRHIVLDEQLPKKERQCMGLDSFQSTTTIFALDVFTDQ